MHFKVDRFHAATFSIGTMTRTAVVPEILVLATGVRQSSRVFGIQVFCMIESNASLVLPLCLRIPASPEVLNHKRCTVRFGQSCDFRLTGKCMQSKLRMIGETGDVLLPAVLKSQILNLL